MSQLFLKFKDITNFEEMRGLSSKIILNSLSAATDSSISPDNCKPLVNACIVFKIITLISSGKKDGFYSFNNSFEDFYLKVKADPQFEKNLKKNEFMHHIKNNYKNFFPVKVF